MKIKKIASIFIAITMLLSVLAFTPIASANVSSLSIDTVATNSGGFVTVPVRIENNPGVHSMNFRVNIACPAISLSRVDMTDSVFSDAEFSHWVSGRTLTISITNNTAENVVADGIIVNLVLNIPDHHARFDTTCAIRFITFPDPVFTNYDGENVGLQLINGGIEIVVPPRPGTSDAPRVSFTAQTTARVTWTAVPNATHYRVYRMQGTGSWVLRGTVEGLANTVFIDQNLPLGRTFRYRVVAENQQPGRTVLGAYSAASTSVTTFTARRSRKPRLTAARRDFTVRRVSNIVGAGSYEIRFRRVNTRRWTTRTMGTNWTRRIAGRTRGNRYEVQIRAIRRIDGGRITLRSEWSRSARVRTPG